MSILNTVFCNLISQHAQVRFADCSASLVRCLAFVHPGVTRSAVADGQGAYAVVVDHRVLVVCFYLDAV